MYPSCKVQHIALVFRTGMSVRSLLQCAHPPCMQTASGMSSLRDSLLGTWRLIDVCVFRKGETQEVIYPMWKTALGSLIYSPDGYM